MKADLNQRLFLFSLRCLKYLRLLPETAEYKIIKYQLAKSSTSSGANYEEAQAGSSRADFNYKVFISLREMRESNYWLRIVEGIRVDSNLDTELYWLLKESQELKLILGSIVRKSRTSKGGN
jgi:four helix bundle protein